MSRSCRRRCADEPTSPRWLTYLWATTVAGWRRIRASRPAHGGGPRRRRPLAEGRHRHHPRGRDAPQRARATSTAPPCRARVGDAAWYAPAASGALRARDRCGNSLALGSPRRVRLAMMRCALGGPAGAGLPLDLATTLGARGASTGAPLLQAMRQDPLLSRWIIARPGLSAMGPTASRFPRLGRMERRFSRRLRRSARDAAASASSPRVAGPRDVSQARGDGVAQLSSPRMSLPLADSSATRASTMRRMGGEPRRHRRRPLLEPRRRRRGGHPAVPRGVRRWPRAARSCSPPPVPVPMGDEAGRSSGATTMLGRTTRPPGSTGRSRCRAAGFTARLIAARRAHPALHAAAPARP